MSCPSCGTHNSERSKFCDECGEPLRDRPVVPANRGQASSVDERDAVSLARSERPRTPDQPSQDRGMPAPSGYAGAESAAAGAAAPASPSGITIINQQGGGAPGVNPALLELSDKSPGVALLLSFLIVGAGQLYNGQILKGIVMFISATVLWFVLLGWVVHVWSWIDAYSVAKKKHRQWQLALSGAAGAGTGQIAKTG